MTSLIQLLAAFTDYHVCRVTNHQGESYAGTIVKLEHKDDSGRTYNVYFSDGGRLFVQYR